MEHVTQSPEETQKLAQRILSKYPAHRIWLLDGDLAAGKTEMVKGLAHALDLSQAVVSPTFTYLNEYGDRLAHYDLYRLEGPDDELIQLLSEHFSGGGYVAIEWPTRMHLPLSQPYLHIQIHHQGANQRSIKVTPHP